MSGRPATLEQIQRWMQSVIMHPGGVADGIESAAARRHLDVPLGELESVVGRSRALSSEARLEIYVDAYFERLMECLREEFAATRHAVGDELFAALAFGYLQNYPSRTYTLNFLGADFPRYLAESRLHAQALPEGAAANWPDFVIELAALERLQRDVFDAVGNESQPNLDVQQLTQIAPPRWPDVRLIAVPCLRIRAFDQPVHRYWSSWRQGEQLAMPAAQKTWLAINRRDYVVERHDLSEAQFALLQSVLDGLSLGKAIGAACEFVDEPQMLVRQLGTWFEGWARAGFFVGLADADSRSG